MIRFALILAFAQMLRFDGCTTSDTVSASAQQDVVGEWVLQRVFLGDVVDTPCGWEAPEHREMTLKITRDAVNNDPGTYVLNGQSSVNQFFGSYAVKSFDKAKQRGTIRMGAVGGTKMAGPEPLMRCEYRYYSLLEQSEEFLFVEDEGKVFLHLGIFKKDNTPSRDGGTYLIFEKKK